MNTVFITGANGLLGSNTVLVFLEQGYQVVAQVRSVSSFVLGKHERLKLIEVDILNNKEIKKAMEGCEVVVHVASLIDPKIKKYQSYYKVNVIGTKNIVESAIANRVKKIIYVGTANVYGYGTLGSLGCELHSIKDPFSKSPYSRSKKVAQEYVLSKKDDIEVVVVNPTFMLGAYDTKPSSGKLVLYGLNKSVVFYPPGGKSFVCVQDVSRGIVKAVEKGKNGESYILSNENLSYKAFFKLLKKVQKSHQILVRVPKICFYFLGFVGDLLRKLMIKTPLSSNNLKVLCINSYYSNKKAREQLGVVFSPIEKGIAEAAEWFNSQKYVCKS
ncbi:NAD-dependent epimerase/dehydratase family protein [Gaetbulibacter saemankumensis]|uniref:NAD-dependent epimerase/dehydratase family protein n=1 Tax=Gaetbulibacter saemankumensis TaxID=311208 RepID=UPI0004061234|nr:NAD-dependent epimerase/dehydratase family protein [Gaetbulibacter saemankumensis]